MRKQFDLNYYLEHPDTKVVTRDERSVRIHCTDLKNERYPIVASFIDSYSESEEVETYTRNGKCIFCKYTNSDKDTDLFFELPDPVKKKVPLTYEDLQERVKDGKTMWISGNSDSYMKCIIGCNTYSICMLSSIHCSSVANFKYQELMECSFIDGDPCWKEVEE